MFVVFGSFLFFFGHRGVSGGFVLGVGCDITIFGGFNSGICCLTGSLPKQQALYQLRECLHLFL